MKVPTSWTSSTQLLDPVIKKAEENGYEAIITADSVGELAEKLNIPAAKLQKTIDDYNSYCDHGQDREFFKNPDYLHKLTGEGGYLVGKFYSGAYGTVGGVKIDENCQVLDGRRSGYSRSLQRGIRC
ncbi:FAD-binding protein [Lactobacillus delbrueckii]|uniref:FAD-binding protein n=1 Tax=Lactobacillus delbrueckii TaxID=1584 RepID=UPI001E515041|nr:FAD-binding protein [Lactobacillus delbrueckii]MCD5451432.1 FAD-binding protein [Lactobacillus delbrueckii subsp. lactis]